MPPDTQWSGNPNLEVSVAQGNVAFDDPGTTYDAAIPYDGAPTANLINIYTPNDTLWMEPNPL
jgi:hypothetical protein